VLAVAGREAEAGAATRESDESGLKILGLIGFSDPIRPQVKAAVEECQSAGVRVKLITGDHVLTAHAVADASAIAHEESGIITGPQLDSFSKEQFDEALERGSVFARVRPEQKYAIVDALKRSGEVVAMTGDGINDTPAMRRADVAISMGRRATEVARSVADLVLLQDDFSAIPVAIREGRHIYANIQRAFLYLIGFKSMLVLTALAVPLVGFPILLLPVHLVWLELIVHPISALAFEDGAPLIDVMRVPPRDPAAPFIDLGSAFRSAACGTLLSIAAVGTYLHDLAGGENRARTMAIAIIIIGSLAMVAAEYMDPRSSRSPTVPRSLCFWLVIVSVALSLPVFMSIGPVAQILMIAPISAKDWLLAFILGVMAVSWRFVGLKK
jgi:Ca2+-transporting ATPase